MSLLSRPARLVGGLVLALLAPAAAAQTADSAAAPPERPTVGLVLSGGAAKGLAHVGAIRAIEAAGVPVDLVTGTSMGAIVGGLYAAGYPTDSLEAIVEGRDWIGLFDDAVDRRLVAPEARVGGGGVLVSLPIEGGSLGLPSGLVAGQNVFELLTSLLWPVQDVQDFTQLPRPFAAVVVDVETGEPRRLTSGYLPLAIRASMSLPSLFTPVAIDGRRYIDGGVARNLPAEDALALGADVLVCVDVSKVIDEATDGLDSFFDVLVHAAFYQSEQSLGDQKALCDVLIEPDTEGLSSFSFDAGAEWIARGVAAAEAKRAELDALADRVGRAAAAPPTAPAARTFRADTVAVVGVEAGGEAEKLVRRRLGLTFPADLTAADAEAAVRRVYASGAFDIITYRVVGAASDSAAVVGGAAVPTLVLDVRRSNGDRLGFGFRYDTVYDAALLFSLQLRDLVQFGSTTRLDARLGEQVQLQGGYFTRLGIDEPLSVAAQAGYVSVPVPVFTGAVRPTAQGRLDVVSASVLGGPIVFDAILTGLGPNVAYVRDAPDVAPEGVEGTSWTYASASAFAAVDDRDREAFPSRGVRALATAEWAPGVGASFRHVSADAELWVPLARGLSVGARAAATRAWGEDLPADRLSFLGGAVVPSLLPGRFFPLYGAERLELAGRASQLAAVSVQFEVVDEVFARVTANAGRAGDSWSLDTDDVRGGVGAQLGVVTLAGPASLTVATDFDGVPQVVFSVGRSF
ncbi:patatin-like phospholipase family protein [Rubrivirga sp. S365]|uniref:patatin-like phospholipase family protein n=1 Tax=Rubrivirga sp. S365 TaxID=3076080 RepID=UPI0028C7FD04|nr:patatin-like phospholipase family protein [Rubrivirga sp. S365]MDT7855185.1 patatin-like phospholipase family protein [Rubrivirga sp. S365]